MNLRATKAEVIRDNFLNNLKVFKNILENKRLLCLTIKANAYGHGLIPMAHLALKYADFLAVATVNEGVLLRESGITVPILLLSPHIESEIPIICRYQLSPVISHGIFMKEYQYWAEYFDYKLKLHLKIDTGMGRAGVFPEEALVLAQQINSTPSLCLEGLCTHLASADETDKENQDYTKHQITLFQSVIDLLKAAHITVPIVHAANSSGVLSYPHSLFNMGRIGIGAYGYIPHDDIHPVLQLKTKILVVKNIKTGQKISYGCTWTAKNDTQIGILPIGYADGYKRALSNKAQVMIEDVLYPVIGRICMDQTMIEIPKLKNAFQKDVLLFGDHPKLNAGVLASKADTIPYEILTSISERVPRIYC